MNHAQFWGGAAAPYEIEQSLRFDGSAYLDFTPSTGGDATEGTFSAWVKKASTTSLMYLFSSSLDTNTTNTLELVAYVSDEIRMFDKHSGSTRWTIDTSAVYRDPSAWHHILYVKDTSNATSTDRIKLFINGVRVTDFSSSTFPSSGVNGVIGSANAHRIGGRAPGAAASPLEGYMAEVHYLDGISVTDALDFGEYDDNGVWRPIEYTGSYGTNGFYLKFDPSATNGIGHDHSGNGNNFTPTGFDTTNTTASTYDVMSDTPTTNWCTLNPLAYRYGQGQATYSEGNLKAYYASQVDEAYQQATIAVSSGKFYWEYKLTAWSGDRQAGPLISKPSWLFDSSESTLYWYKTSGAKVIKGTTSNYGASFGVGDVIGVAMDFDGGNLEFFKNGTSQGVAATDLDTFFTVSEPAFPSGRANFGTTYVVNFGQRDFAYTPPTGFKALNTSNLSEPDIADGSEYFDTLTYTGPISSTAAAGTTGAVTGLASGFTPDLVWIKCRNQANWHQLFDQVRGVDANGAGALNSNDTGSEVTTNLNGGLSAFNDGGFTVIAGSDTGGRSNNTGSSDRTYAAWCWDAGGSGSSNTNGSITSTVSANPTAGFSIVSYSGTGTAGTVAHGLGVAPSMIIEKNRDRDQNWVVYHSALGATKALILDGTFSEQTATYYWNDTAPTSNVFSVGTWNGVNDSTGQKHIAYCFAEVEGYSKISSYTANASTDGPFIHCGFKPALIIFKNTSTTEAWSIFDAARNDYNGPDAKMLLPSSSAAEATSASRDIDFLSNGFKLRVASGNNPNTNSGNVYIFAAFAENPFGGSGVSPATAR